jgi:hypothetical protein
MEDELMKNTDELPLTQDLDNVIIELGTKFANHFSVTKIIRKVGNQVRITGLHVKVIHCENHL